MATVKVVYAHTIEARDAANAALLSGKTPEEVATMLGDGVSVSEAEAGPADNWPTLVYDRQDVKDERAKQAAEDAKDAKTSARRSKSGG